MKNYRMNSLMAGLLYLLGTVFGIGSAVVGGEVIGSVVTQEALSSPDLLALVEASSAQISAAVFMILMMGISLVAMTVFLYPLFRRDSEELAAGMLLFRGALEGAFYLISAALFLALIVLGHEYTAAGADSGTLQAMGNVFYKLQSVLAPFGAIVFLIGASCLYVSFYRTRLIPRWLSIWGLVGVIPYFAYALMSYFQLESSIGVYLQVPLGLQEMAMALWLIVKGFNSSAIENLMK